MNTFRMKEKESVEAYKTRFHQKLILSGRETTKGDPDQLRQDQLLWFKKDLSRKWALECVNKNLRTLDKWQELADELITMEKEEGNLFVVTDNKKKRNCYNCGKKDIWLKIVIRKQEEARKWKKKKSRATKKNQSQVKRKKRNALNVAVWSI